jgi:hypothetical protein
LADVYGVTHADISAELPGLFPGGFSAGTKPTDAQVTAFISIADTIVALRIDQNTGIHGAATDRAASLAKQYIVEWVKAKVLEIVYAGNDPVQVSAAVDPVRSLAKEMLTAIDLMGTQAEGIGDPDPRVTVGEVLPVRDLVITNEDLDAGSGSRGRF